MIKRVQYLPNLVEDAGNLYNRLLNELDWYHADEAVPRKEYYVNDYGYDYTYGTGEWARTYSSMPTHEVIESIRVKLEEWLDVKFDVVFLNLYENKRNHLGWHADDSPEMSHEHPIVTVSLGAEREIWFRENGSKEVEKVLLENGSACAMIAGMQKTHQHRIPKCSYECGTRISLTFRKYVEV